ncbi:hypothetical protein HPB48_021865 [Haemaphysalis longicornis]|uniref:Uncharacterized protein n=1 Tax=Haemaphysalis longicornis TaxID=44386 RepID=A0A9J6FQE7_HAELO|nr:hypothetical protein HPB48_021865 [Haemaphysalis longicornis]
MSRLLQHVTETVDALSSVRTYGVADRFRRHFCRLTDDVTRGYSCFLVSYSFTRALTSTAGFVVVHVHADIKHRVQRPRRTRPERSGAGSQLGHFRKRAFRNVVGQFVFSRHFLPLQHALCR